MKFAAFGLSFLLLVPGYMAKANRILTEAKPASHVGDERVHDALPGVHLGDTAQLMDGESEEDAQQRLCAQPNPEWPLMCPSQKQCCNAETPWCCPTSCCPRGYTYCGEDGRC